MITRYIYTIFIFLVLSLLNFSVADNLIAEKETPRINIGCGPISFRNTDSAINGKFIPVMPGWGHHSYLISSKNDSTKLYFNQGLTMYFSYHMREAVASFREAARFDPSCAMAYWGEALALGPNYNFAHYYKMPAVVPETIRKMNSASSGASAKEKDLVQAMNKRYDIIDSASGRNALNEAWSKSVKLLTKKFPGDDDLKALYVDAVMLEHPWDFWYNNGDPKPWTPEIKQICENILAKSPDHPAALHYFIHITEASRQPEVALHAAGRLTMLFPGVAHMVHMSSHEYERNGLYPEGVDVNEKSDIDLIRYDSIANNLSLSKHVPHYYAVEAYCAMSGGMYKKGLPVFYKCRHSVNVSAEDTYEQFLFMIPEVAMVRLGKWDEILHDSVKPDKTWSNALIFQAFARGIALAHIGKIDLAQKELNTLEEKEADTLLLKDDIPFNSPREIATVADHILRSSIFFYSNQYDSAIACLKRAVNAEDSLIYAEPKQWLLPARQYLGYYLLKAGKPLAAEKVFKQDLDWNPGNGWSALGLYQSLIQLKRFKEAEQVRPIYLRSFSAADEMPPSSVY